MPPSKLIAATITGAKAETISAQAGVLCFLARIDEAELIIDAQAAAPENAATLPLGDITAYLPLAGMVDLAQERARLEGELVEIEGQVKRLKGLLGSPFAQKAPTAVVQKERDKLAQFEAAQAEIAERLGGM